jgi:hypothetical protein
VLFCKEPVVMDSLENRQAKSPGIRWELAKSDHGHGKVSRAVWCRKLVDIVAVLWIRHSPRKRQFFWFTWSS